MATLGRGSLPNLDQSAPHRSRSRANRPHMEILMVERISSEPSEATTPLFHSTETTKCSVSTIGSSARKKAIPFLLIHWVTGLCPTVSCPRRDHCLLTVAPLGRAMAQESLRGPVSCRLPQISQSSLSTSERNRILSRALYFRIYSCTGRLLSWALRCTRSFSPSSPTSTRGVTGLPSTLADTTSMSDSCTKGARLP